MQGNQNVVFFGEGVGGLCEDNCTKSGVADIESGSKLPTTGRDLNNTVRLGIRKGFEGSVNRCDGSDVDGWVGVVALLGGVNHGFVLFRRCYWHVLILVYVN